MSKTQHLSQFQKEQYTQYLETQLEKFSAFMLSQKKENQNCQSLSEIIDDQSKQISSLGERMRVLELYQRQNFKQCERLESSTLRSLDFDKRLQKVESIYFQVPSKKDKENISYQANKISQNWQNVSKEFSDRIENLQKQLGRKIRQIEKDVKNMNQTQPSPKTNHTEISYNSVPTGHLATKKEVKKMEENMLNYFMQQFKKIQKAVKKYQRKQKKNNTLSKPLESRLVQEQTFGIQERYNGDDGEIFEPSHEKSCFTISDTSTRLKPVNYLSNRNIQRESKKTRKSEKKRSRSKSQPKQKSFQERQKSKSVRSKSKSISQSRSKSNSRTKKNLTKPSPTIHSHLHSKHVYSNATNQYKMECKKKHF